MDDSKLILKSTSALHTGELAGQFAQLTEPGTVIALHGTLGAGKTIWAKGFIAGSGYSGQVVSPTYMLAIPYQARRRIIHVDAYRINDAEELAELGLDDEILDGSIIVIEWYDRFPDDFPQSDIQIELRENGDMETRKIEMTAKTGKGRSILQKFWADDST